MLKGSLKQIVICRNKVIPGQNEVDARMNAKADLEAPVLDSRGNVRTMWVYLPSSGVIPCTSGVFLLREGSDRASAEEILEKTGWAERAERDHYAILFPDPSPAGWNAGDDGPDDADYLTKLLQSGPPEWLIGCKVHRTSRYLAGFGPGAAAAAAGTACRHGELLAGLFAEDAGALTFYEDGTEAPVPAWLVNCCEDVNETIQERAVLGETICRCFKTAGRALYESAWDELFFGMRRMATGGFGSLIHKESVEEMGLKAHLNDCSLGDNGGMAHEWYEYLPEDPAGRIPLVIVLHGGGTSAKYCAEQTGWHELGKKYGFAVVYPQASQASVWNPALDQRLPDDESYLLSLLDHLCETRPIDQSRIYCTGFSMGGVMTHSMGILHPEIFAAIAPFSGLFFEPYWEKEGNYRIIARAEKAEKENAEARMPVIQFHGTRDTTWKDQDLGRMRQYWIDRSRILPVSFAEPDEVLGEDGRFFVWHTRDEDGQELYRFVSVRDLPHGVDRRQPYLAWEYLRRFSRGENGRIDLNRPVSSKAHSGALLDDIQPD